jgi:hypothetical protein
MIVRRGTYLFVAALLSGPAYAAPAPVVASIASLDYLHTPLPYPFNEDANAEADVNAALDEARRTHRLAFVELGANWCADCRILAGLFELPEFRRFLDAHYVVVNVDTGRQNRNLDVPARWGIAHLEGVPVVLIVDPETNRLVNAGHTEALIDARKFTPQSVMDWVAEWVK